MVKLIASIVVYVIVTWGGFAVLGTVANVYGESWVLVAACATVGPVWLASCVWVISNIFYRYSPI